MQRCEKMSVKALELSEVWVKRGGTGVEFEIQV